MGDRGNEMVGVLRSTSNSVQCEHEYVELEERYIFKGISGAHAPTEGQEIATMCLSRQRREEKCQDERPAQSDLRS